MHKALQPLLFATVLAVGCSAPKDRPAPVAKPAEERVAEMPAKQAEPNVVPAAPILVKQDEAAPAAKKPEAAPAQATRSERLEALKKENSEATDAYTEAYHKALQAVLGDREQPTQEDFEKAQASVKQPDFEGYIQRAQALLDEDVADLAAFQTIRWMLENARGPDTGPKMFELLEKHHMNRPEMGDLCPMLAQSPMLAQTGRGMLDKLVANSPHAEVRGKALMATAESLKSDAEMAEYVQQAKPKELEGMKGWLGAERLESLQHFDPAANKQQVEAIYERLVKEFSDVKVNAGTKRESTLGKQAASVLYALRNLKVGNTAPEIEGVDLDEVAFKLSDYRGKVVLLDFWGNW